MSSRNIAGRVARIERGLADPDRIDPEVDLPILRHMLSATFPYDPKGDQTKREWEAWIEEMAELMVAGEATFS